MGTDNFLFISLACSEKLLHDLILMQRSISSLPLLQGKKEKIKIKIKAHHHDGQYPAADAEAVLSPESEGREASRRIESG